ncbi:nephronectin-like [Mizuhopecten yessoensis]|uniref:Fibrillin-1 n=1 Tax=Mizuhopecten yessoensis TaxID=6573 RepID=A0A210QRG9_MIZYE|nr:nephronectin-like [Mizuhopecten yessoensis]OWF51311.1 Fibrillin-1 [Mizuhopecten yessoensis]
MLTLFIYSVRHHSTQIRASMWNPTVWLILATALISVPVPAISASARSHVRRPVSPSTTTLPTTQYPCGCDRNAVCIQDVCRCKSGFVGNGYFCEVNVCLTGDNMCDKNADCYKSIGSYKCVCKTGFEGDGFKCRLSALPPNPPNPFPNIQRSSDVSMRGTSYRSIQHELIPLLRPKPPPISTFPTLPTSYSPSWFTDGSPSSTTTKRPTSTTTKRAPTTTP